MARPTIGCSARVEIGTPDPSNRTRNAQLPRYISFVPSHYTPLLFIPTSVYASGGDIVYLVIGEGVLLAVVTVTMSIVSSIKFTRKVWVFVSYFLGTAIPLFATNKLPYTENMVLINILCLAIPVITWLAALWLVWQNRKRQ